MGKNHITIPTMAILLLLVVNVASEEVGKVILDEEIPKYYMPHEILPHSPKNYLAPDSGLLETSQLLKGADFFLNAIEGSDKENQLNLKKALGLRPQQEIKTYQGRFLCPNDSQKVVEVTNHRFASQLEIAATIRHLAQRVQIDCFGLEAAHPVFVQIGGTVPNRPMGLIPIPLKSIDIDKADLRVPGRAPTFLLNDSPSGVQHQLNGHDDSAE